jgi:predicted RNA-binding protein with RPS1 domain
MLDGVLGGQSENPDLWALLESLRPGENVPGTISAIERYGVFVALDRGPAHPIFPGVGFITLPELSRRRLEAATDIIEVGQRVVCAYLQFDTTNLEARLSLRATQPDAFQAFADQTAPGRELTGRVTRTVPFGLLVRVADGVEGFVHIQSPERAQGASEGAVQVGDELAVVVTDLDRTRRRLALSLPRVHPVGRGRRLRYRRAARTSDGHRRRWSRRVHGGAGDRRWPWRSHRRGAHGPRGGDRAHVCGGTHVQRATTSMSGFPPVQRMPN